MDSVFWLHQNSEPFESSRRGVGFHGLVPRRERTDIFIEWCVCLKWNPKQKQCFTKSKRLCLAWFHYLNEDNPTIKLVWDLDILHLFLCSLLPLLPFTCWLPHPGFGNMPELISKPELDCLWFSEPSPCYLYPHPLHPTLFHHIFY